MAPSTGDFASARNPEEAAAFERNFSCEKCHGGGPEPLAMDPTPQQIGGYSDEQLRAIFTMGVAPEGAQYDSLPETEMLFPMFHRWAGEEFEYQALVVYLRSLPPVSQGARDFIGMVRAAASAGEGAADAGSE